jgi:hypothetical protein
MSINPIDINTIRVGQLAEAIFNLTDQIPHEVALLLLDPLRYPMEKHYLILLKKNGY